MSNTESKTQPKMTPADPWHASEHSALPGQFEGGVTFVEATPDEEQSKHIHGAAEELVKSFQEGVDRGHVLHLSPFGARTVITAYLLAIKERDEARRHIPEGNRYVRDAGGEAHENPRIALKIANRLIFTHDEELASVASVLPLAYAYLFTTTALDEARRESRPEDLDIIKEQSDVLLDYSATIEKLEAALGRNGADSTDKRLAALEATAEDLRARQLAAEDHIAEIVAQRSIVISGGATVEQRNAFGEIIKPLVRVRYQPLELTADDEPGFDNPTKH